MKETVDPDVQTWDQNFRLPSHLICKQRLSGRISMGQLAVAGNNLDLVISLYFCFLKSA